MHQDVAVADGSEDVALVLVLVVAEPALGHRHEVGVLQLGALHVVHREQPAQVDRRCVCEHVVVGQLQLVADQFERLGGDVVLDLEAHRLAEASATQLHLDRGEQVVGLLVLDGEVRVAGDPEAHAVEHLHAGEQLGEVHRDDLLERHEALAVGQHHEPGQQRRHLDPGEAPLAGVRIADDHAQVQRQRRDVGERVARIDRQRGEHREDAALELVGEPLPVVVVELGPAGEANAHLCQRPADGPQEQLVGPGGQPACPGQDRLELLRGGHPVDAATGDTCGDTLLQPGDTHLEELVEVLAEDRQELDPLEQRRRRILGKREHPRVEVQPGELTVEVAALVVGHPPILPSAHGAPDLLRGWRSGLSGWRTRPRPGPTRAGSTHARRRG